MKKTLKMISSICLVIALLLSVSACFGSGDDSKTTTPQATTPAVTTPVVTTPEATTPTEEPDPDKPEGAVLVESVNGKTADELLADFAQEFSTATSYDWSAEMTMTDGDFSMTQIISMKLSDGEFVLVMGMDGANMEIYFVDDVLYMNAYGEKIQIPADSIDEVLGEGTLDGFLHMSESFEISDAELAAAADANIYLLNGEYIVTVHYVNEDTDTEETSVFYFNAAGELTEAESYSDEGNAVLTIHSCNKPVEINPPADADEYAPMEGAGNDTPVILPEDEDAIYEIYTDLCTTLQECEYMWAYIDTVDVYIAYEVAGEDKSITIMDAESTVMQHLIDNVGYVTINYGESLEVPVDEEFLGSFASIEALFPINVLAQNELQNLRCSYDADWGEIVIEFEVAGEDNMMTQYKYAIEENGAYIEVTVTELVDGIEKGYYSCSFSEDPDLEIELPIGK